MKRKFAFMITIAFILIDVFAAFLTQEAIISNLMGVLIGVGLIIALILITKVLTKLNIRQGKLVFVAVFFFLILGRLVMTTLTV
ncbi:hypothetical protein [Companilactobacillus halodurans]|uniref:Uncharacterized protein n=2 Tax=Companilactobacillus halodurans TaxID=2584183 RepID=A0A5P0ZLB3_9LACO|nr:hypothetical protein [Companilactobacillus halodurans]MQS75034.1 hypothetical protein [Companilactobacillus halodurans]